MRLLLDHCVPRTLRNHLSGHVIATTFEQGWSSYKNGALLSAAEEAGFAVLISTDQNLVHQQNMSGRQIAIVVLCAPSNRLADLLPLVPKSLEVLEGVQAGEIRAVTTESG